MGLSWGMMLSSTKVRTETLDRDAINMLISFLLEGEYQVIVVDRLTDLTNDLSDLEELLKDAERVGGKGV